MHAHTPCMWYGTVLRRSRNLLHEMQKLNLGTANSVTEQCIHRTVFANKQCSQLTEVTGVTCLCTVTPTVQQQQCRTTTASEMYLLKHSVVVIGWKRGYGTKTTNLVVFIVAGWDYLRVLEEPVLNGFSHLNSQDHRAV